MNVADIRQSFLSYFQARAHEIVPSSALVPANDPTLFFTNAGMVQFKDTFVGLEKRPYSRATTCQKCLRVSGKHNDLENVGRTPRHHTFFEMLGNFSFGDYFKDDAIPFAWTWLTEILRIPEDRLWVTIHHSDDQAFEIWRRTIGVPERRIQRLGDKDNFWSMGETGPCGPCSEIHYDHGPAIDPAEGGPASESPRYVEIWNLVFMQYNRDSTGHLEPLPRPSIDTGAGLERIAAVMQGVFSNYDTDCFTPIMARASALSGVPYGRDPESDTALRVIADHARAAAFLISDGILPSNLDRGYVLRRILRRAIRYGVKLGMKDPFLFQAVDTVIDHMGGAWTELLSRRGTILEVVRNEEERFSETLDRGMSLLNRALSDPPERAGEGARILDGELVFKLHDTFGFPLDLTRLVAEERGAVLDEAGYEAAMARQRERGRQAWKGSGGVAVEDLFRQIAAERPTRFTGYTEDRSESTVDGLIAEGAPVGTLSLGQEGLLLCPVTPFYGESGGQLGDTGQILSAGARLKVIDTRRPVPELTVHQVQVEEGEIHIGDSITLELDNPRRSRTRLNHTATHLLHAALKKVLGGHVAQKGSLVGPDRLRFDFSHHRAMTRQEIEAVESQVQAWILENEPVETRVMDIDQARATGAEALFGEKYGESVRVVFSGSISRELCGGTHARRTGDIGIFKILGESGIAAGVRRVEAQTGLGALGYLREREAILNELAERFKSSVSELPQQVAHLDEERKRLEKELDSLKREAARRASDALLDQATSIGDIRVLAAELPGDPATLRDEADRLRDRLGERSVVVLGCVEQGNVRLVATVSRALVGKPLHAGKLVGELARRVGGAGGGRPDMAQAGGKQPEKLQETLQAVTGIVTSML